MGRTRMGRTDGRTDRLADGQGGDYMLPRNFSGSIKSELKRILMIIIDISLSIYTHKNLFIIYINMCSLKALFKTKLYFPSSRKA